MIENTPENIFRVVNALIDDLIERNSEQMNNIALHEDLLRGLTHYIAIVEHKPLDHFMIWSYRGLRVIFLPDKTRLYSTPYAQWN